MTKVEIIVKAIEKRITWIQAATILGISDRQMRRLKTRYEKSGFDGIRDQRGRTPRRHKIPVQVIEKVLRLKREVYMDFSVRHFHEKLSEHGLDISYTWTKLTLQSAGLAEKLSRRGTYRRARERRPMRGMLIHMDGSTHPWISGLPSRDLIATLDDATGEILDLRFVLQEGTMSTFAALDVVLRKHGRFGEFYTDKGSHFRPTQKKDGAPIEGEVGRALRTLGIRQILAQSPQARGRSERMFQTLQGRLPQELRLAKVVAYDADADIVLERVRCDINRRFAVKPEQAESAFVPVVGTSLALILSRRDERLVGADNRVSYNNILLQLPETSTRISYARCRVTVHEFIDQTLGVAFDGQLLATFSMKGTLLKSQTAAPRKRCA